MKTRCSLFVRNKISVFAYKTLCPSSTQQHHTFRVSITEIRLTIRKTAARSLCIFFLFFFSSSFLFFNINLFDEKNPQNSQRRNFFFVKLSIKKKRKNSLLNYYRRHCERFRQPGWFLVVFSFATEFRASRFLAFLVLSIHHETASYLFLVRASRTLVIQPGESLNHTKSVLEEVTARSGIPILGISLNSFYMYIYLLYIS